MREIFGHPDVEAEAVINCCLVTEEVLNALARLLHRVKVVDGIVGAFVGAVCAIVVAMGYTIDSKHR
jgi:hypothetical protein